MNQLTSLYDYIDWLDTLNIPHMKEAIAQSRKWAVQRLIELTTPAPKRESWLVV